MKTVSVRDVPNEIYDSDQAEAIESFRIAERKYLNSRTSENMRKYKRVRQI